MMNSYSNMLEQSLSQAELRARKVTELLAKDSAEKSQSAIREIERLRQDAQTHTQKAVAELQANFTSLSDQVSSQLTTLSSKFSDTTRVVRDTTRRAAVDLESAQNELQRHAKILPETAKQSASAMRRALQDQLSALDALSDLASRHAYTSAVAAPEQRIEPQRREREQLPPPPPPVQEAALPLPSRAAYDYGQAPVEKPSWAAEPQPPRPSPAAPVEPIDMLPLPASLPAQVGAFQESGPADRRGQWSLGDLLARASEDEPAFFDRDEPYALPPQPQSYMARSGNADDELGMDFTMSDIASCIDDRRVMDIWQKLKRGETDVLNQRGMYPRQGQQIVDRVQRRYETDTTFHGIVDRYLNDFEKMLQDLSRTDPRGATVQSRLASDEGRIYFVLAHISGRLGA